MQYILSMANIAGLKVMFGCVTAPYCISNFVVKQWKAKAIKQLAEQEWLTTTCGGEKDAKVAEAYISTVIIRGESLIQWLGRHRQ